MAESTFLARMLAARERWVELEEGGPAVLIRRPAEARLPALMLRGELEDYAACVVDWRGVTEATLLGAALASETPLKFDAALWREVALDNVAWLNRVVEAVRDDAAAHLKAREEAAKN